MDSGGFNLNSPIVQKMMADGTLPQSVVKSAGAVYGRPMEYTTEIIDKNGNNVVENSVQYGAVQNFNPYTPPQQIYSSPTSQFMYGVGNQRSANPVAYTDNSNPFLRYVQPQQQQIFAPAGNMPFMSPREMVINQSVQQQQVYYPTPFAPRNIVGANNYGYNQAFNGYSNPFIGQQYTSNYQAPPIPFEMMSDDMKATYQTALERGVSYNEQVYNNSAIYKMMSRIVNKSLGKSEEEIEEISHKYDVKTITFNNNNNQSQYKKKSRFDVKFRIVVKCGDDIVSETAIEESNVNNELNKTIAENIETNHKIATSNRIRINENLYNHALERNFDKVDNLFTFFNECAGKIVARDLMDQLQYQKRTNSSKLYKSSEFKKNLLLNNGNRPKEERKAVDRFYGRYGYLPGGIPVSPQHDPSISECFSYDENTGQVCITAPKFIQDRVELAKQSFIQSVDS